MTSDYDAYRRAYFRDPPPGIISTQVTPCLNPLDYLPAQFQLSLKMTGGGNACLLAARICFGSEPSLNNEDLTMDPEVIPLLA